MDEQEEQAVIAGLLVAINNRMANFGPIPQITNPDCTVESRESEGYTTVYRCTMDIELDPAERVQIQSNWKSRAAWRAKRPRFASSLAANCR